MIKSLKNALYLASALFMTTAQPVFAHAGHDHSSPMSGLLHAIFYLSIFASAGAIAFTLRKMWKQKNEAASESK